MAGIQEEVKQTFPQFSEYLTQQFGDRVSIGFLEKYKNQDQTTIHLNGKTIGVVERNRPVGRGTYLVARIDSHVLGVESKTGTVILSYSIFEKSRKDKQDIPFP